MAKAFLFIFLGILPSYLLSENLEGGFGTIVNDQNEPISFFSDSLFFNEKLRENNQPQLYRPPRSRGPILLILAYCFVGVLANFRAPPIIR